MLKADLYLTINPFVISLQSSIPSVIDSITNLYEDYRFFGNESPQFIDFHISIARPPGIRYVYRPQVNFFVDGKTPFKPLPLSQAYPFFEWGLNWCIANYVAQYLLLHAAVVAKNNCALILPGQPGAGKSTLSAALVNHGWRLLSDEMAVIDLVTTEMIPIVRPISLKNQSIDLIKKLAPEVVMGNSFLDTSKGTVAHMRPPKASVAQATQRAKAKWLIFPTYKPDSELLLTDLAKGEAVLNLTKNAFNYNVLGGRGFEVLCDLVSQCQCHNFSYSNIDQAIAFFNDLSEQ